MKEQYAQKMQIVIGTMEIYASRELMEEAIDKTDSNDFLRSFDYIINNLKEEEEVKNPFVEIGADD